MLMFTSTLLTMMSIGGFPSFVEDMKVKNKKMLITNRNMSLASFFSLGHLICSMLYICLPLIPLFFLFFFQKKIAGVQKRAAEWALRCYCICHR
jgi:hypothetical protein